MATLKQVQKGVDAARRHEGSTPQKTPRPPPQNTDFQATSPQRPPVPRDERGHVLKGYSLNPGGRPKGIAAEARELLEELDWKGELQAILEDEDTGAALRLEIIKLLLDRGHGKAVAVNVNAEATVAQVAEAVDLPTLSAPQALQALEVARTLVAQTQQKPSLMTVEPLLLARQAETDEEVK